MKIALIEPLNIPSDLLDTLSAPLKAAGHVFTAYPDRPATPEETLRRVMGNDIVMIANMPFPESVVRGADRLRMLDVAFTGIDHVAAECCREKEIMICNCANYSNQSVAEMTLGLALGLLRRIPEADRAVRGGKGSAGLMGGEIAGRTVGVIGTGRIGERVIDLFLAFGARVAAYSRTEKSEIAARGVAYLPLDALLAQSDIVTLHVPATPETRHLIGERELRLMRGGSLLINCARGPVVDTPALKKALEEGWIGGAAVDVFDQEPPLPGDHPLLGVKNLLLTPHTAYLTREAMERRARIAFSNVSAYLDGAPRNVCR